MLLIPLIKIFSFFFLAQFLGTIIFSKKRVESFLLGASIAIPLSFSVFSLMWIIFLFAGNLDDVVLRRVITEKSIILTLLILTLSKIVSYFYSKINFRKFLLDFWVSFLAGSLGVVFQLVSPKYFIADSYYLINWSASGIDLLDKGFPLIGISLANLSLFLMNDFYLNAYHNFFSLSLISASIITILFSRKSINPISKKNDILLFIFTITIVMIFFIFNGMFFRHSIYVNYNLLAGCYILFSTILFFLNRNKLSLFPAILIFLFLSSLVITRFEGVIISIIILWFFALYSTENIKLIFLILASSIYNGIYLTLVLLNSTESSFVSSELISFLIVIVFVFPIVSLFLTRFFSKVTLIRLTTISSICLLIFLTLLSTIHMLKNLSFALINLNPLFWGCFGLLMLISLYRLSRMLILKKLKDFSIFGLIFLNSLIILFCLTFFRESLRFGMNDSFNRMLLQIAPTFLPFIVFDFTRLIKYYDRKKRYTYYSRPFR